MFVVILIQCFGSVLLQRLLCFAHSLSIMLKVLFANKINVLTCNCQILLSYYFSKSILESNPTSIHEISFKSVTYCVGLLHPNSVVYLICKKMINILWTDVLVQDQVGQFSKCFIIQLSSMEKKYPSTERICRTLMWQSVDI